MAEPEQPHDDAPAPAADRLDRVLLRRGNLVVTQARALVLAAIVVLLVLGLALPYLTLDYIDAASKAVTASPRLSGAGSLLGGIDPTYLPGYRPESRADDNLALNLAAAGPGLQEVGSVVALLSSWALLTEEVNRIAWWFWHLSAYPLLLAPVPLLVGTAQLHGLGVHLTLGAAWVPGLLAGLLVWSSSWWARGRIDTYGSF